MSLVQSDLSRAVDILHDLIAIPSVNPAYDPPSEGESAVATYVECWARSHGLAATRGVVLPGRENVIVRLETRPNAPILLLEAHMDTVSADTMPDPFAATVRDGHLYGRGACDTKGSLAAMMAAVESLVAMRDELPCTVILLAAVDEETSGTGVRAWVEGGHYADAAIVGEPTRLRVIHAHNGVVRGAIGVSGRAAHTSVAHEGINAIDGMAEVVLALRGLNADLASRPGGATANGSFTVSIIAGGTGINIVPEQCVIHYDRRTVPGDQAENVLAGIDATLDAVRTQRPDLTIVRHDPSLIDDALDTSPAEAIVVVASEANDALGLDPAPTTVPYGSDGSKLSVIGGIPTVVYGPGDIAQAHGADEYVELSELTAAAAFYREVAMRFRGHRQVSIHE
ncbi:MAG TPA: M20/M25/M40 family metallo-hydrolase [Thermomicrobiales bacterium]|nr:M20/M25/M40 family metallo-hydrolase [Thermomicrobiales bacterium]